MRGVSLPGPEPRAVSPASPVLRTARRPRIILPMNDRQLQRSRAALLASLDLAIEQASDPAVRDVSAPAISKWSVKDHLEHLAIANEGMVEWIHRACDGAAELESGGGPNLLGRIVLLVGAIPRGKGKAPERTIPQGMGAEDLVAQIRRMRGRVEALGARVPQMQASIATRKHFAFGDLNAAQWLRFAEIHNHHHQKIIRDVLATRS